MPACPSGVQYGSLIEAGRSQIERRYERPLFQRLFRSLIFSLFPYPQRLKLMTPFFYIYERLGIRRVVESSGILRAVSDNLAQMGEMLPRVNSLLPPGPLPEVVPAKGKKRFRVALLTGCVQSVFFNRTNEATVRVLAENGCEVIIPRARGAVALCPCIREGSPRGGISRGA